jgi:hypothetical protein
MGLFGGSNSGKGLGTGKDLPETVVNGRIRRIVVTRSPGTSDSQHAADVETARKQAG